MRHSIYKVPDGKMIKVKLDLEDDNISYIVITGDFFIHPEETLAQIEELLLGTPFSRKKLISRIALAITKMDATLIGATIEDFAEAILQSK